MEARVLGNMGCCTELPVACCGLTDTRRPSLPWALLIRQPPYVQLIAGRRVGMYQQDKEESWTGPPTFRLKPPQTTGLLHISRLSSPLIVTCSRGGGDEPEPSREGGASSSPVLRGGRPCHTAPASRARAVLPLHVSKPPCTYLK